ncbi:hypothetical protein [Aeromicrobium choanae]|uniref:Uncharacterized protein n=1 Tax=Aeromicrobium choanae TaxID=1736691 RepID=A0A1T4Z5R9_9ACTN|nr:hypothetical protein [Aeromicrobium choanae]SKB09392.1 hypothetical protein SAMN06295964_2659 [Aeromicrobium choanae]
MSLRHEVISAITRRMTDSRLQSSEEAVVLMLAPDPANGYDRPMTVIIPFAHIPTSAPAGDDTPENLATWMLRDLGEEYDLKSEATCFYLTASSDFVGLCPALRDPV